MRTGYVYFLLSTKKNVIKVGFSKDVARRIQFLEKVHGSLHLIGTIPGSRKLEGAIHRGMWKYLATEEHHQRGEWFTYCPEVATVISAMIARGFPNAEEAPDSTYAGPKTRRVVHGKITERAYARLEKWAAARNRTISSSVSFMVEIALGISKKEKSETLVTRCSSSGGDSRYIHCKVDTETYLWLLDSSKRMGMSISLFAELQLTKAYEESVNGGNLIAVCEPQVQQSLSWGNTPLRIQ